MSAYDKAALERMFKQGFGDEEVLAAELDCLMLAVWFDKASADEVSLAKQAKKVLKKHASDPVTSALSQISRRNYQQPKTQEKYLGDDLDALLAIDESVALGLLARIAHKNPVALRRLLDKQDIDLFTTYFREHHIGDALTYEQVHDENDRAYAFSAEEVAALLQLSRFEELCLRCEDPIVLPKNLSHLTELHTLDLWNRETETIDFDALATLPSLRDLTLALGMKEVPEEVAKLPALTALDLSGNELTSLPEALAQLGQLKSLKLGGNAFTELPSVVGQLTTLEVLSLRGNWKVSVIPDFIGNLGALRELDLGALEVSEMSPRIGELRQLQKLRVSHHETCEVLFEQLGNLNQLTFLHLGDMPCVEAFPKALEKLVNLEVLSLDALKHAKGGLKGLKKLRALREFKAHDCKIPKFPKDLFTCENLEVLEIHSCDLTEFPDGISSLKKLRSLDMYCSSFASLPSDFTDLEHLEVASFSMSSLERVPEDIGKLKQLKKLVLTWGRLSELPDSITECEALEYLSVARNDKFSRFPDGFDDLVNLKSVNAYWCNMGPLREHLKTLKPKMKWCHFITTP